MTPYRRTLQPETQQAGAQGQEKEWLVAAISSPFELPIGIFSGTLLATAANGTGSLLDMGPHTLAILTTKTRDPVTGMTMSSTSPLVAWDA